MSDGTTQEALAALLPTRLLAPWVALLAAALAVAIGIGVEGVDYPTPFAIAHALPLLVGAELFFLLVLVPILAPTPRLTEMLLLLCLGAPAVVVAAWVADASLLQALASQAYLVAAALFVAALQSFVVRPSGRSLAERAEARTTNLGARAEARTTDLGWYWMALGALGAGGPFIAFIAEDLLKAQVGWLYAASPFWVADRLCRVEGFGWDWAAPFAALLALAAALVPLARRPSR
ncbi:MAG: hypothetical protein FJ290_13670 [Planctomycetes bacterium]|nr:hypothetical protein [Planctomycetota bacterium]